MNVLPSCPGQSTSRPCKDNVSEEARQRTLVWTTWASDFRTHANRETRARCTRPSIARTVTSEIQTHMMLQSSDKLFTMTLGVFIAIWQRAAWDWQYSGVCWEEARQRTLNGVKDVIVAPSLAQKGKTRKMHNTVNSNEALTDLITRGLVKEMELESKNLSKRLELQARMVTSEIQTHMILLSSDKLMWRCIL